MPVALAGFLFIGAYAVVSTVFVSLIGKPIDLESNKASQ